MTNRGPWPRFFDRGNNQYINVHNAYMVWTILRPPNSLGGQIFPTNSRSVIPITHMSMCILLVRLGPFLQPQGWLQSPNSLGGQVWPQIWKQWPQLPTYICAYCSYCMDPFLQHGRSLQPPNSLGGQVWPQIWNQWPQLTTYLWAYCLLPRSKNRGQGTLLQFCRRQGRWRTFVRSLIEGCAIDRQYFQLRNVNGRVGMGWFIFMGIKS